MPSSHGTCKEALYQYKCADVKDVTHTRIGDQSLGIYGGKYNIPDEEISAFYKIYHREVILNGMQEFLTEKQLESGGPILVDLDFRFDPDVDTRQHGPEHIEDIIELYLEQLKKILVIPDKEIFPVFALEKPDVNATSEDVTKDGIHLVFGIHMEHTAQLILRDRVLNEIGDQLEDLPLVNDYESVLDVGISKGTTNWQLFGSRKPGHDAYQITHYYDVHFEDGEPEWEQFDINNINMLEILPKISARKKDNIVFPLEESVQQMCDTRKRNVRIKKKRNKTTILFKKPEFEKIKTKEELEKIIEDIMDEAKNNDEYKLQETHDFTMILSSKYYEPREAWVRVGWALHNTDYRLFPTWLLFSSQSSKFSYEDVPQLWNEWNGMRDEGVTDRSLMYWAKEDNISEYMRVKEQTIGHYIDKTIEADTEYDIARVLYQMCGDCYKCVNIKNKIWYEYSKGRWSEIDSGTTLRKKLSTHLAKSYNKKQADIVDSIHTCEEEEERIKRQKLAQKLSVISMKLRKTAHKNNIMREACEHFFDKQFRNELDKNPHLLCFKNGVIDFEQGEFRKGKPDDYVSLCTGIDYVPFDDADDEHIEIKEEIMNFMRQLFPDPRLNTYMWEHLASVLRGDNKNQTFNIYTGCGRNGKSKLVEFLGMALGDYKGTVPITLITQKRTCIGSVSPEIAQLKGLRYAVMQEPSQGMTINEGVVKELTGGDPIQVRALFRDTVTYIPQFSLVVCTNHLFDIKSMDDGTWRRIRVCDYVSKFVDKPSADPAAHEFKVDREMAKKFKRWVPVFAALLVKKAFETNGDVKDCEVVLASSQRYKQQQDYFTAFFDEMIVPCEKSKMSRTAVKEEFERWYTDLYRGAAPQGKDLYDFLDKKIGKVINRYWVGYQLNYSTEDDDIEPNGI